MKSSCEPFEWYGKKLSDDFGSWKTFGWFVPLFAAGQPSSVNQIGFDRGSHSVGAAAFTPPIRSTCGIDHQLTRSL